MWILELWVLFYFGHCSQWEMNIYFSYPFGLLLYDVYFRSSDARTNNSSIILRFAFCCCVFVKLSDIVRSCKQDKVGLSTWFNHFIGRFSWGTKPRPRKLPTLSIVWHPLNYGDGVDLGFYKSQCPIYLKGAPEIERSGEGAVPLPQKIMYFLYQNGEFLCIPGDVSWCCNCKPLRSENTFFSRRAP